MSLKALCAAILLVIWVAMLVYAYANDLYYIDLPNGYVGFGANSALYLYIIITACCIIGAIEAFIGKNVTIFATIGFVVVAIFGVICYTTPMFPWGTRALFSDAVYNRVMASKP
jgi:hypothetical protein